MKLQPNNVVPPYANRGVQNTCPKSLTACVDWLQVTFKSVALPDAVIELLGLSPDDFIDFESGKYGFHYHKRFGHIAIYYSHDSEMVHLEMSGQGCREYEQFGKYDWMVLLSMILMLDVNIPRLDLAIDDTLGYFHLKTVQTKIKKGEVRSLFKRARVMEDFRIQDGENLGTTCYFGSPKSEIQIRLYDKYKQLKNNGKEVPEGIDFWNRYEIQMRDDRAKYAALLLSLMNDSENVGEMIKGIFKHYITFVNRSSDTNKSRWPVANFWKKFLKDVNEIRLVSKAPDSTIIKSRNWIENNVSASLDAVLESFNYDVSLLIDLIVEGNKKRTKKHENMINRFRKDLGINSIDTAVTAEINRENLIDLLEEYKKKNESSGHEDSQEFEK